MAKRYETALSPAEEQSFQQWKTVNAPNDSGEDYDLRGAFKANISRDSRGHGPDTFKKPNHPTFSIESQYSAPGGEGGKWYEQGGKTHFTPAAANLKERSFADLQDYFRKYEPDAILDNPQATNTSAWKPVADTSAWKPVPDEGDRIKAGFENQPPLSAGRIASEAGKMLISPVTGLINAARALPDWIGRGMPIEAPMSTPHLPGDNGNPVEEAAGNMAMALPIGKGEVAAKRSAMLGRMGVAEPPKPSAGPLIDPELARDIAGVVSPRLGRMLDATARIRKGIASRRAQSGQPTPEMLRQASVPLTAEEEALAQHVMDGVEPGGFQLPPAPRLLRNYPGAPTGNAPPVGADYLMPDPATQIPASASPMQLAPFSPRTVLDYMQERAKPVLGQPSELAKEVAKRPARAAKVVTIPSPEPEFPAETYAASARATKAGKLATLLHEHGIPYEDAKLMGEPEWAQAAQAAGVKVPSGDSVKLALFELKKLGKQGKLSEMNPKAAKIAVDLDKEMNK